MLSHVPVSTDHDRQVLEMLAGERMWPTSQQAWVSAALDSLFDDGLASPLPELRITALGRRVLNEARKTPSDSNQVG